MKKIETVPSMRSHAAKLGISVPEAVWIMPMGFFGLTSTSNVLYDLDYELLVKLFRMNNIPYSLIDKDTEEYGKLANNSFELAAIPTMAFAADFLAKNPKIISKTLVLISDSLRKRSRLYPGDNSVRVAVIKEGQHGDKQYTYEGSVEGLSEFGKIVQEDGDG